MALKACKECGNPVSDKADACPKCGAKQPKGSGFGVKTFLAIIIVGTFGSVMSNLGGKSANSFTPQPTAEETRAKEQESKRTVLAIAAALTVKKAVRDPDSLRFETVRVDDAAKVACIEYRARNGFGGMNREFVVFEDGKGSNDARAWNAKCVKPMNDLLEPVTAMVKSES